MVYRLENATGAGSWQNLPVPSGTGVANWSTNVSGLALGANTVRVRTLNGGGGVLKEVSRSVRLAVMRPLTVEIDGDGGVTNGFAGTTQREVGMVYTIRAVPKATAIFSHWEGFSDASTRDTRKAGQSFAMQDGLLLRAHFVPNPFLGRSGTYEALVLGGSTDHANTGLLRLALSRNGGFSGQLTLGPARLAVRGTLNSAGSATVTLVRPGLANLVLTLQLDLTNSTPFVAVTLSDGTDTWSVQADRRAPVEPGAPRMTRRYTLRIDPDAATPNAPQGYGYAVARISAANTVAITGKLADGRSLNASTGIGANGKVSLYAPLFGRAGAFAASIEIGEDGTLTGTGHWFKPERPLDARYQSAFNTAHAIVGGRYVSPPPGTRALAWEPDGTGVLTLSSGDLSATLAQSLVLGINNAVSWAAPAIPSLRVNVNAASGYVSGTFLHPSGGVRAFRGVLVQRLAGAWGCFLGPTESGAVSLQAAGE
jgi:hypothetical protein